MEQPINPRITVQNATGSHWLVTFEHAWDEVEQVSFTVRLPKGDYPLPELASMAAARMASLLVRLKELSRHD